MKLVALAKNPVPGGAVPGELIAPDGTRLRFVRWEATRGPRRGTVCLFGGRGEFAEKYFEVVADLRRRGFAVATMDWRGQGGSSRPLPNPLKGHVTSFSEFDGDLLLFMKEIVLPDCPPPFIALGHSMGANILLRNAARPGSWFERMILCAPMIEFAEEKVGFPQSVARTYAEAGCLLGFSRSYVKGGSDRVVERGPFEGNELTSDRERWYRNKAVLDTDPSLSLGSPTIGWLRAAYRSMALVSSEGFAASVKVPMMVFVAGKDQIVSSRAVEDFAVGLKVGTHVLLPAAQHEILQEADAIRLRFWAAFDAYMGLDEAAA
ncbi:alpha/beta fold hydrolase [Hyphomicrobium sp.]|uniref:alpha/beta fold hydrolase n=1 Tax=Hyphomicrobium sp. TaxID=82 RepID=UPI003F6FDB45